MLAYPLGKSYAGQTYVVTLNPYDYKLLVRTQCMWRDTADRLVNLNFEDRRVRILQRLVLGNAVEITADHDGVLWVPDRFHRYMDTPESDDDSCVGPSLPGVV